MESFCFSSGYPSFAVINFLGANDITYHIITRFSQYIGDRIYKIHVRIVYHRRIYEYFIRMHDIYK